MRRRPTLRAVVKPSRRPPQRRPRHPMPSDVQRELGRRRLLRRYRERPAYQRNDYIGWINRAKRPETRWKRIAQMLDELERGDRYMKMVYRPKRG